MKSAYELVTRNMKKSQEKQKEGYDQRIRGAEIRTGDRVLVKIVSFDGKRKISDKWEEEPYLVLDQPDPSIPVLQIQKETSKGKIRTLHRNLLLPIGHLESYKTVEELEMDIPKLKSPNQGLEIELGISKIHKMTHSGVLIQKRIRVVQMRK